MFIDGTRGIFKNPNCPPEMVQQEREQLKAYLIARYGQYDIENKLTRYLEFDAPNICIVSEYLDLLHSIADAYVYGSYYPALTGACSLGERIFNILILRLRQHYRGHELYKQVHGKGSFQDWDEAINVLKGWNVIDSGVERDYRGLADLRNKSVHFGNISNIRELSIAALKKVMGITDKLFGQKSDYFFWCPGEIYVKKEKEKEPFVREFIIPNCVYLGYKHTTGPGKEPNVISIHYEDCADYEDRQVSDAEFRQLRTD